MNNTLKHVVTSSLLISINGRLTGPSDLTQTGLYFTTMVMKQQLGINKRSVLNTTPIVHKNSASNTNVTMNVIITHTAIPQK